MGKSKPARKIKVEPFPKVKRDALLSLVRSLYEPVASRAICGPVRKAPQVKVKLLPKQERKELKSLAKSEHQHVSSSKKKK